MPTISGSPSSFSVNMGGASSQAVSFAVPAGTYVSGSWQRTVSPGANEGSPAAKMRTGAANDAAFPLENTGSSADTATVTAAQLADINAAAGGTLSASYFGAGGPAFLTEAVSGLALTLTAGTPAPPPPSDFVIQFPPPLPPPPVPYQAFNGVILSDPPPPVVSTLAFVRFSMCRDNRGALWTPEYLVGDKADVDSVGGCWLGNGFGCLYSQKGSLFWLRTDDPEQWGGAAPQPVSAATGHVYGLAQNRFGVLCAVVDTHAILSRDRGATWTGPVSLPISDPAAKPVSITTASDEQAFVIVQPNGDGTAPTHFVSFDGGQTWL